MLNSCVATGNKPGAVYRGQHNYRIRQHHMHIQIHESGKQVHDDGECECDAISDDQACIMEYENRISQKRQNQEQSRIRQYIQKNASFKTRAKINFLEHSRTT
ncbi:MAG: hypothetical protein U5K79_08805 [Cyclobacteriaceae bacterium]|nr:hypothetical protein [Cyclobacteriaceae bacterium]